MARGDFPFNRLELNLQPIVARPRVRAEVGVPLNNRRPGGPTCGSERQSTTPPQPRPRARRRMLSRSWTAPGSPSAVGRGGSPRWHRLIAGQAFPRATDFSAAKIAVFAASFLSDVV